MNSMFFPLPDQAFFDELEISDRNLWGYLRKNWKVSSILNWNCPQSFHKWNIKSKKPWWKELGLPYSFLAQQITAEVSLPGFLTQFELSLEVSTECDIFSIGKICPQQPMFICLESIIPAAIQPDTLKAHEPKTLHADVATLPLKKALKY